MDIDQEFKHIEDRFSKSLESVNDLLKFDQTLVNTCLVHLNDLKEKLESIGYKDHPDISIDHTIQLVENVRKGRGTQHKFQTIFNQCLVLAVSHFASVMHNLFKICIKYAFINNKSEELRNEELKFTVQELADISNGMDNKIGEIISEKNSLIFQDIKSISRAYKNYFRYKIDKTKEVDNIIFGQACRHAIVHNGATVDKSMLGQIKGAPDHELDLQFEEGDSIHLENDKLDIVMDSMKEYLHNLIVEMKHEWKINDNVE